MHILMLVDRRGSARPLTTARRAFETPAVSPDGRRIVVAITAANDSLWAMEFDRPSLTRITCEAENAFPVWSPDGARLALGCAISGRRSTADARQGPGYGR